MSARSRLGLQLHLTKDEEQGKRDDDYGWKARRPQLQSPTTWLPWRWRRRRVILVAALLAVLYLLHYLPFGRGVDSQVSGAVERTYQGYDGVKAKEPKGAPPRLGDPGEEAASMHYYNGIVRFYKLAGTLQKLSRTMGAYPVNNNVLFAAASLKSVANLIPMACEMARVNKNYAHLAIFGRSSIPVDDILELNGVDAESCKVYFHDARGDYAEYSSDARAESATRGAMKHMNDYMHPQAIIMDDSAKEDPSFTRGLRSKTAELEKPLIEITSGKYEHMLWMMRLEANSISNWFKPSFDIVVQAPSKGTGRLIRLLRSLARADYSGLRMPRLTIELPPEIDQFVEDYLAGFNWPPGRRAPSDPSLLTIRHRIPNSRLTSEQASLRFVESFYPSRKIDENVLVLSPQAEVNPLFLQYLQYLILNYRYTSYGLGADELLGIALDVPVSFLNGRPGFQAPAIANTSNTRSDDEDNMDVASSSPFLYQAPSTSAILVFGDKWATFHDFLANRIRAGHVKKPAIRKKMVSEASPSWAEYLLELMRSRNWFVLHPASDLVTIHNELAEIPEEFIKPDKVGGTKNEPPKPEHAEEEPFLLSPDDPVPIERVETESKRASMPLHQTLPFEGDLQDLTTLPFVSYVGAPSKLLDLEDQKDAYIIEFRNSVGGCEGEAATRPRAMSYGKTDDLFCLPGQSLDFDDEPALEADPDLENDVEEEYEYASSAVIEGTDEDLASTTARKLSTASTEQQKLTTTDDDENVDSRSGDNEEE